MTVSRDLILLDLEAFRRTYREYCSVQQALKGCSPAAIDRRAETEYKNELDKLYPGGVRAEVEKALGKDEEYAQLSDRIEGLTSHKMAFEQEVQALNETLDSCERSIGIEQELASIDQELICLDREKDSLIRLSTVVWIAILILATQGSLIVGESSGSGLANALFWGLTGALIPSIMLILNIRKSIKKRNDARVSRAARRSDLQDQRESVVKELDLAVKELAVQVERVAKFETGLERQPSERDLADVEKELKGALEKAGSEIDRIDKEIKELENQAQGIRKRYTNEADDRMNQSMKEIKAELGPQIVERLKSECASLKTSESDLRFKLSTMDLLSQEDWDDVDAIINLFKTKRADTVKEALGILERRRAEEEAAAKLERIEQEHKDAQERMQAEYDRDREEWAQGYWDLQDDYNSELDRQEEWYRAQIAASDERYDKLRESVDRLRERMGE